MVPLPTHAFSQPQLAHSPDLQSGTIDALTRVLSTDLEAGLLDLVFRYEDLTTFSAGVVSLSSQHFVMGIGTVCVLTFEHVQSGHVVTTINQTLNPTDNSFSKHKVIDDDRRLIPLVPEPAVIVIPMGIGDAANSSLSFQAHGGVVLGRGDENEARTFARAASVALRIVFQRSAAINKQAHLRTALRSRTVINLAVGMVMT